ncbi:MAG: non-ribosomal peptide synthetase, partial [bacterium]|nr:non-ribosomal peptide synthetase [bacterium]
MSNPSEPSTPRLSNRREKLATRRRSLSAQRAGLSDAQKELLAKWTRKQVAEPSAAPVIPRRPPGPAPLSFAQQRLWFLDQLEPGSPIYNLPTAVRLDGRLDPAAMERSFQEIMRRHEVLRTTYASAEGEAVQVVNPAPAVTAPVVDLRGLKAPRRGLESRRLNREESRRPFDLERDPMLRVTLLQLGEEEFVLLLTLHHIASDAWSTDILIREFGALYRSHAAASPADLPELPIQYADFAAWQRRQLRGEALEEQLSYWRRQLAGIPADPELPVDRPRPPFPTYRGAERDFTLPGALLRRLEEIGQRQGATMFMTLLAAFMILLHRYTGRQDLPVGTPIANRDQPETEG